MREIKFRGKRLENGEWVYGYLVNAGIGKKIDYRIVEDIGNVFDYEDLWNYKFDQKTIGQYIGLKDENGIEIYEGDIVRCWGGEQCQGYHEFDEEITVNDITYDAYYVGQWDGCLVVGNIYSEQSTNTGVWSIKMGG